MKIILQDIYSNYEGFSSLTSIASQTKESVLEEIELDFSRTGWLDANMCAPLGAILYKLARGINTIRLLNLSSDVEKIISKNTDFRGRF